MSDVKRGLSPARPLHHLLMLAGWLVAAAGSLAGVAETEPRRVESSGAATHQLAIPWDQAEALLVIVEERGRDMRVRLLDTARQPLVEFESPGRDLGRLVLAVTREQWPTASVLEVVPERASSSPGAFTLSLTPLPAADAEAALALSAAARAFALPSGRQTARAQFAAAAAQPSPWQNWAIYWAALAENDYGDRSEALALLAPLLEAGPSELAENRELMVLAQALEARIHLYLGDLAVSERLFADVIDTLQRLVEEDPVTFRAMLVLNREYQCVVVQVYQNQSENVCGEALAAAEQLGDPYLVGLLHIDLASHQILNHASPDSALPHAEAAVAAFAAVGEHHQDDAGNAWLTRAKAQELLGRFAEAKLSINRALELITSQERRNNLGWAYRRAAELSELTGDYSRAAIYGESAIRVLRDTGDTELAARASASLAEVYLSSGSPAAARRHAEQLLAYYEEQCRAGDGTASRCGLRSEYHKARLLTAHAIALDSPDPDGVRRALALAQDAFAGAEGDSPRGAALAALELRYADVLNALRYPRLAEQRLDSALTRYADINHALGTIEVLARRAQLHFAGRHFEAALADAEDATRRLSEFELELAAERMGPALRAKLFDQFGLRIAARSALGGEDLAQAVFDIAVESLGPRGALGSLPADPALDRLLSELAGALHRAAGPAPDVGSSTAAEVARALDAVDARLLELGSLRVDEGGAVERHQVQAALAGNEALIHYLWWEDRGWAVVLDAASLTVHEIGAITPADLQAQLSLVDTRRPATVGYDAWQSLGRALLPPLADRIDTLYVIPDGPLQVLPLGALPLADAPGQPVLSRYVVTYLSSYERFRAPADHRVEVARGAVVFADPAFAGPSPTDVRQTAASGQPDSERVPESWLDRLGPLPWAEQEAREIGTMFGDGGADVFVGPAAGKRQLGAAARGGRAVWHFATHGYFSSDFTDIGGLVLAQIDEQGQRTDGLFTVHDARAARIDADLVVLNGCETGLGTTFQGEGVMGFTRAFVASGVANTISTLWKVPDRAAHEIMVEFYGNLLESEGEDVAAALVAAQRSYLARHPRDRGQPTYWGGYVHHQR